ncbi:MAG: hypothetical protein AB1641_24095 [Thermodesulfobacteriota bacterium]
MAIYRYVGFPGWLYEQLKLNIDVFNDKQNAEDNLDKAFRDAKLFFNKKIRGDDIVYENEQGVTLITITLAQEQPKWR